MSAISGHIYRLRSSAYPFAESEKLLQLVARFPKMFRVEDERDYAGSRRMPVDRWILSCCSFLFGVLVGAALASAVFRRILDL
jgi:hypothetical protein